MQEHEADTVLGEDIVFRGRLQFKKSLRINGKFKGKISTAGQLVIGQSADVEADIEAGTVTIHGNLRGNILAKNRIDLMKAAKLHGDMRTPELQIQHGSQFNGNCIMDEPG